MMMHKYSKETLTERTIRVLERLTDIGGVRRLEEVLDKYPDILYKYQDYEKYPHILIVDTFLFEKLFTSIGVGNIEAGRVKKLMKDLEPFFFVALGYGVVHISRFKTLVKATTLRAGEQSSITIDLSDDCADFAGVYYEYTPKLIVQYCFKKGKEHLQHLIKKYNKEFEGELEE